MAMQQNCQRLRQLHFVPHRDKNGLGTILSAQDSAERFPLSSIQGGMGAPSRRRFYITPNEPGLGAANGGDIEEQTHMTGNSKATWMGNALAVKDHDIWSHF